MVSKAVTSSSSDDKSECKLLAISSSVSSLVESRFFPVAVGMSNYHVKTDTLGSLLLCILLIPI